MAQQNTICARLALSEAEFHAFLNTNATLRSRKRIKQSYKRLTMRILAQLESNPTTTPTLDPDDHLLVSKASKAARNLQDFCVARFSELIAEQVDSGGNDVGIQAAFVERIWSEVRGVHGWKLNAASGDSMKSQSTDGERTAPVAVAQQVPNRLLWDFLNYFQPIFHRARNNHAIQYVFDHVIESIIVSLLLCVGSLMAIEVLAFIWRRFLTAVFWSVMNFFIPRGVKELAGASLSYTRTGLWSSIDLGAARLSQLATTAITSKDVAVASLLKLGAAVDASSTAVENTVIWVGLSTISFFNASLLYLSTSSNKNISTKMNFDTPMGRTFASQFDQAFDPVFNVNNISIQILPAISVVGHAETLIMGASDLVSITDLTYQADFKEAYHELEYALRKAGKAMRGLTSENELMLFNVGSSLRYIISALNEVRNAEQRGILRRLFGLLQGERWSSSAMTRAQVAETAEVFLRFLDDLIQELDRLLELLKAAEVDIDEASNWVRQVQIIEAKNSQEIKDKEASLASKEAAAKTKWIPWRQQLSDDERRAAELNKRHRIVLDELILANSFAREGITAARHKIEQCSEDMKLLKNGASFYLDPKNPRALKTRHDIEVEVSVFSSLGARVGQSSNEIRTAKEHVRDLAMGRFQTCRGLPRKEWDACFFGVKSSNGPEEIPAKKHGA